MSYTLTIDRHYGGAAGSDFVMSLDYDDAAALAKGVGLLAKALLKRSTPEAVAEELVIAAGLQVGHIARLKGTS